MFSIISESPGEPILHAARRGGSALWGEGIPGASVLPCATECSTAKPVVPQRDCVTGRQHLKGQSHIGEHLTRPTWAGGGAKPARSPSATREGERAVPPPLHPVPIPLGPMRHWSTSTLSKQTTPKTPPQTHTHTHSCHTNRDGGDALQLN